jgi:hypothetical protein
MFNDPNKRGKITENEFILYSTQQCLTKNVYIIITYYCANFRLFYFLHFLSLSKIFKNLCFIYLIYYSYRKLFVVRFRIFERKVFEKVMRQKLFAIKSRRRVLVDAFLKTKNHFQNFSL